MKLIYIAAPYRAKTIVGLQHNISQAKILAQYQWIKGNAAICPHLNTANFDGLCPDENFLLGTKKMLVTCDEAIFHPDAQKSQGCIEELDSCYYHGIKAIILTHEDFDYIEAFVTDHIQNLKRK